MKTTAPWNEQTQHQHLRWSCLKTKSLSKNPSPQLSWTVQKNERFFSLCLGFLFFFGKKLFLGFTNSKRSSLDFPCIKRPKDTARRCWPFSNQGAQANSSFGSRAPTREIFGPTTWDLESVASEIYPPKTAFETAFVWTNVTYFSQNCLVL